MPNEAGSLLNPGSVVGRYFVERLIGTGGMGAVFEATHMDLKKRVALKTLHPDFARRAEVLGRFLREGTTASKIRHPHVVDVTDVGSHEGIPYLVMEYLEGEDLASLLAREGAISTSRIADLLIPVMDAVATAHDHGVIHRDLKPANIFLTRGPHADLHPKVLDFGISKVSDASAAPLTQTSAMLGTVNYMSPEQARGAKNVDAASDQFALGVILYECATGRVPFTGETVLGVVHAIVTGNCPTPRSLRPELPPQFEALIQRAMASVPAERFPDVRHLARATLPFAGERTRVLWSGAMVPATEEAPLSGSAGIAADATVPPAMDARQSANGVVSRDASPQGPMKTTLGESARAIPIAAEFAALQPRWPWRGIAIAIVGLSAIVLGTTFAFTRTGGDSHPQSATRPTTSLRSAPTNVPQGRSTGTETSGLVADPSHVAATTAALAPTANTAAAVAENHADAGTRAIAAEPTETGEHSNAGRARDHLGRHPAALGAGSESRNRRRPPGTPPSAATGSQEYYIP